MGTINLKRNLIQPNQFNILQTSKKDNELIKKQNLKATIEIAKQNGTINPTTNNATNNIQENQVGYKLKNQEKIQENSIKKNITNKKQKDDKDLTILLKALTNKNTIDFIEKPNILNGIKAGSEIFTNIGRENIKDKTKGIVNNVNAGINVVGNTIADWGGEIVSAFGRGLDNIYENEYKIKEELNKKINPNITNSKYYIPKISLGEHLMLLGSDVKSGARNNINESMNIVSNPVYKITLEALQSATKSLMDMSMGPMAPTTMLARMSDSYYNEGLNRGLTPEQAELFGTVGAIAESVPSLWSLNKIFKGIKGKGAKSVLDTFKGLQGEGVEEAIMEPFVEGLSMMFGGEYSFDDIWKRMVNAYGMGVFSAGLVAGVGQGIGSCVNVVNKIMNNENVLPVELEKAKKDLKENNIDTEEIEKYLDDVGVNGLKNEKAGNKSDNKDVMLNETIKLFKQNQQNGTIPSQTENSNINNKLSISGKINSNSVQNRMNAQNLRESVEGLRQQGYKIEENTVNMLETFSNNRGASVVLDNTINSDGLYNPKTRTYRINPNSTRSIEFIAIHEMLHDMQNSKEYRELCNFIQNYANNKEGYAEARKQIEDVYKRFYMQNGINPSGLNMDIETTNDMVAQALGNQEFLNGLAQTKPSVFTRIYNWIKEMGTKIFGTEEAKFLQELKKKFEKAYNSTYQEGSGINYHISSNFSTEIDNVLNNNIKSNTQIKARDYTPDILVKNGVKDLPMLITQKHIKSIIYTLDEAKRMGLPTKNVNYHGLGKDLLIKAIDNLDNPQAIYKTGNNNYLVVTEFKDNNNNEIIVPIQINSQGRYNNIFINENQIKTVYGKNNLKNYISKNKFEPIYIKNEGLDFNEGIQYSNVANSSLNNSIQQDNTNVNSYSMQNSEIYDKWQDFLDKNFDLMPNTSKTRITKEMLKEETSKYLNKVQRYKKRAENRLKDLVTKNLDVSRYSNKDVLNNTMNELDENIKNNTLTDEKKNKIFEEMYNNLKKIDESYYNEYKDLKKTIRNTKLYVNDTIKGDIADYNQFRKDNMGNVTLTNDKNNISVDKYYEELNEIYPNLFPSDIANPTDRLLRIVEVQKDIVKTERNLSAYADNVLSHDFKDWAREDFNNLVNDYKNSLNTIERYEEDKILSEQRKQTNINMVKNATVEDIKELYNIQTKLQKEYDRINDKELLTEADRVQLDRLANGEIEPNEIPKKYNVDAIIRLAKKKKDLIKIKNTITEVKQGIKDKRIAEAQHFVDNVIMKDKKIADGFRYDSEIAQRNIEDICEDPKQAKQINDTYFNTILRNEADSIRFKKKYSEQIEKLNLKGNKQYYVKFEDGGGVFDGKVSERALVQLLGEGKITETELQQMGADVQKIKTATDTFRKIYNELFDMANEILVKNGYAPVQYRKNYFPHFESQKNDTFLTKIATYLGIETNEQTLPTDIAGLTYMFKPGKKWVGNFLRRMGDRTTYDALEGFDRYIGGVSDVIYHTEDILKLRALEETIRNKYTDEATQQKIEQIKDNENLTDDQKREQIDGEYKRSKSEMSNFVVWLRSYTDVLAGKKLIYDRPTENKWGREIYNTMQNVNRRVAANMIGANLNSALTGFLPLAQSLADVKVGNLIDGMWNTLKSTVKKDGLVDKSDFLIKRIGYKNVSRTTTDKIIDNTFIPMQAVDHFTCESIVRAKYIDNLQKGMDEQTALQNADEYVSRIVGDRSKGAVPVRFNAKNPLAQLTNAFQLEVNNGLRNIFKDIPRNQNINMETYEYKKLVYSYVKVFIGSYLINSLDEMITGSRIGLDPIHIIEQLIKDLFDEEKDAEETVSNLGKNILDNIPFTSFPFALLGVEDLGRLPISAAIPDVPKTIDAFMNLDTKKGQVDLLNQLKKPISYFLPPTGGGQAQRMLDSIIAIANNGDYKYNSEDKQELRIPMGLDEMNTGEKIVRVGQSLLFGKYATPYGREYVNSGFKTLSAKQTANYKDALKNNIKTSEFLNTYKTVKGIEGDKDEKDKTIPLSKSSKVKDTIDEINSGMDLNKRVKMYEYFGVSDTNIGYDNLKEVYGAEMALERMVTEDVYKDYQVKKYILDADNYYTTRNEINSIKNYDGIIDYYVAITGKDIKEVKKMNKEDLQKEFIKEVKKLEVSTEKKKQILKDNGYKISDNNVVTYDGNKKKVLKAIANNTNLTKEQKMYLILCNYNIKDNDVKGYTEDKMRREVANYVKSLNVSKDEKKALLEEAGYKVSEDGKIRW